MFNPSDYDTFELGSSPCDEACVQVGKDVDYIPDMRAECQRYKTMLEKRFPDYVQYDAHFKICANPHDFGVYYEVGIRFDAMNERATDFACFVDEHLPATWDDEAVLHFDPTTEKEE